MPTITTITARMDQMALRSDTGDSRWIRRDSAAPRVMAAGNDEARGLAAPGFGGADRGVLADEGHVRGAGPLGALRDLEPDLVTLGESAKAVGADLGVVDEDVRTTLVREKTETLGIVEPLDGAFDHERAGLLSLVPSSFVTCALTKQKPPTVGGSFRNARATTN
jgi:hypothetical protein